MYVVKATDENGRQSAYRHSNGGTAAAQFHALALLSSWARVQLILVLSIYDSQVIRQK